MAVPAPAFAIKLVAPSTWNPCGVDSIAITLSGDAVDLTDPAGPTDGYSCRAIRVGGTGGVIKCMTLRSGGLETPVERTITVAANTEVSIGMCVIGGSGDGTTATPIEVVL